ncbi:MAG TPA: hypothetical protein PLW95_06090 [bacterium]|nr:hypothetical protein [bacterium]
MKETCQQLQEDYYGTHGLRWNYAQEQHQENMENGMTYEQSLNETSEKMGHSRADITEHYLK